VESGREPEVRGEPLQLFDELGSLVWREFSRDVEFGHGVTVAS
jgi:hypothetical protein